MPKLPLRVRLQILGYALRYQLARRFGGDQTALWTLLPLGLASAVMLGLAVGWRLLGGAGR
jgi:hypothetical protein